MNIDTAWKLFVAMLACGAGVALSLKPWQVYHEQRERAQEAETRMEVSEANYAELRREQARRSSPLGREEMAREQDYLPRNERPLPSGP